MFLLELPQCSRSEVKKNKENIFEWIILVFQDTSSPSIILTAPTNIIIL